MRSSLDRRLESSSSARQPQRIRVHAGFVLVLGLLGVITASSSISTTTTTALHRPRASSAAAFLLRLRSLSHPPPRAAARPQPRHSPIVINMSSASPQSTTLLPHLAAIRDKATVVLASKSPRRVEIMGLMGLAPPAEQEDPAVFRVLPSGFPEDLDKSSFPIPADYATMNAECKAREVAARLFAENEGGTSGKRTLLVIGSDTIVDRDGTILEKPDDEAQAFGMISSLQGRQHLVHSGVAVFSSKHPSSREGEKGLVPVARFCETARVTFAPLTEEEIWSYVKSGEPMDKAGSYGIQGIGGQMVKGVEGCYFAVMGLPMHSLSTALAKLVHTGLV